MKKRNRRILIGLIFCVCLAGGLYTPVNDTNYASVTKKVAKNRAKVTRQNRNRRPIRHRRKSDRKFRIYSHHYLSVEHTCLYQLKYLGNRYAKSTNHIYYEESSSDNPKPIYKKWFDGNYWSYFKDHKTFGPKGLKVNNKTFNIINRRVLEAHGVHHGVNFKGNLKHKINYSAKDGIAG